MKLLADPCLADFQVRRRETAKPVGLALLGLVAITYVYAAEILSVDKPTTEPGANVCQELPLTGDYYVRATAWDADGNQSALSNEVLKTFPGANPVCWKNPTENIDGTPLTDLTKVTVYYSTESITGGQTDEQVPLPTPIQMTSTTLPEQRTVTLDLAYLPAGDLTLNMTVNDADVANEGFLRADAWEAELFRGQVGPDAADHPVTYTIPASAIQDCQLELTFGHTSTAGYVVRSGILSYIPAESCEIAPPVIPEFGIPTQEGSTAFAGNMLVGVTGKPVTVAYSGNGDMQLELVEYGGSSATLSGTSSSGSWTFTPAKAGLYFVRIRPVDGEWTASSESQLFYFKLAAPGGGGIN